VNYKKRSRHCQSAKSSRDRRLVLMRNLEYDKRSSRCSSITPCRCKLNQPRKAWPWLQLLACSLAHYGGGKPGQSLQAHRQPLVWHLYLRVRLASIEFSNALDIFLMAIFSFASKLRAELQQQRTRQVLSCSFIGANGTRISKGVLAKRKCCSTVDAALCCRVVA